MDEFYTRKRHKVTVVPRKVGVSKAASTIRLPPSSVRYHVGGKQTETFRLVAVDDSARQMTSSHSLIPKISSTVAMFSLLMLRFTWLKYWALSCRRKKRWSVFVGDLSVQEYLRSVQSADSEEGSTVEDEAVESES